MDPKVRDIIVHHLKDFNPVKVGIFGLFASGDNKKGSDLDILVKFKDSPSLLTLIKLENELSEIFRIKS